MKKTSLVAASVAALTALSFTAPALAAGKSDKALKVCMKETRAKLGKGRILLDKKTKVNRNFGFELIKMVEGKSREEASIICVVDKKELKILSFDIHKAG
ncbi:hypothetical protein KFE96_07435 [Kordiimonas sp. SCSIO 12603]|uniref:hypothetical protein n=1 Tax=Kordiimonas sp. SCSIO 12603 TaxID=2829596 RepID=UPI002101FDAB|nr:hypothetical protein [Kordiimonas sp. SCSIO 12603]UTW60134.1 hypothetical protein KFE96_07435 [Kordiimonas sp. SCSIO 12603]